MGNHERPESVNVGVKALREQWSSVLLLGALVAGVVLTTPWEPLVRDPGPAPAVDLRVLAVAPNEPSLALIDLRTGTVTEHSRAAHRMGRDAIDGAVITARGHTLVWSQGVARLFTGRLDALDAVLRPEPLRQVPGVAPSLRVVPAPDGASAWLVQPGQDCCGMTYPTLVERVDLPSGHRTAALEVAPGTFPAAATADGLVLTHERLVDTGDGWVSEPGSERVLHLSVDGSLTELGRGRATAASASAVARLACPHEGGECALHVSRPDGSGDRRIPPPFAGRWVDVGGPGVPGDTVPLATISPDGTELLVGAVHEPEGGGTRSVLLAVDLVAGTSRQIGHFDGHVPQATWSRDGRWVVLVEGRDLRILDATDPSAPARTMHDAVPHDHFVYAAG